MRETETLLSRLTLAAHIIRAIAKAQEAGSHITLESLVKDLDVRRSEVREALSELRAEGLVCDAHLRLTMHGFALGASLAHRQLAPLATRRPRHRVIAA